MLGLATSQLMQMPGVDLQLVMTLLLQYFVASLRIGAFLLSAPLFGARWLPLQVRIIMALSMCASVVGLTPTIDANMLTSSAGMTLIFIEIAVGLTAGLTPTIWFAAMLMAGEKIASSSGLGFAARSIRAGRTPRLSARSSISFFLSSSFRWMVICSPSRRCWKATVSCRLAHRWRQMC